MEKYLIFTIKVCVSTVFFNDLFITYINNLSKISKSIVKKRERELRAIKFSNALVQSYNIAILYLTKCNLLTLKCNNKQYLYLESEEIF